MCLQGGDMAEYKQKTVKFTEESIGKLPNNKPVTYKILDNSGKNIYTGIAQRGRVQDRLKEHLEERGLASAGNKVVIKQKGSKDEARNSEARIIKRSKPKYNKQGK